MGDPGTRGTNAAGRMARGTRSAAGPTRLFAEPVLATLKVTTMPDHRTEDGGGLRAPTEESNNDASASPLPPLNGALASLPRKLTLFRLAAVPALWVVAAAAETFWLGVGVAVAAATDVIDGPIARHYRRTTAAGSSLDSLADHALSASLVAWIVWLRPGFVADQMPLLALWLAIGAAAIVVGWLKFRRFGDLHLYSAKVAGTLAYLFAIWLLMFGTYSRTAFHVVIIVCTVAALEHLAVLLSRRTVDEHVGSILKPRGRG